MKDTTKAIYEELFDRYSKLKDIKEEIEKAFEILNKTITNGNKLLICGNGGSASDAEHIVGELLKSFKKKRIVDKSVLEKLKDYQEGEFIYNHLEGYIPAISLTSHIAFSTAYANDNEASMVFAQELYALGNEGDTLIVLSTSGNSKNCVLASIVAKLKGIKVISLTGKRESKLSNISDVTIKVSESETYKIQELHLPIYHALCAMLEEELF